MQGTRWRTIATAAGSAALVLLAGCGRTGSSAPARAERPVTDAFGCGDRRDRGTTVAASPLAVTPAGVLFAPVVVPSMRPVGPCGDEQVTPFVVAPAPGCLDVRSLVGDAVEQRVSRHCRPTDPGVDDPSSGHPPVMTDTPTDPPPTKPLPDLPDEPVPTPMPKDPPLPQPGQPSG